MQHAMIGYEAGRHRMPCLLLITIKSIFGRNCSLRTWTNRSPYKVLKKEDPTWGMLYLLVLGVKPNRVVIFFKIGLCSAISFKRSLRELPIGVAEHRSVLKNFQNTYYPRFSFIARKLFLASEIISKGVPLY